MKLTSSQSNCLVFLEFVDEAQQFIKIYSAQLQQNSSQFKIISFHPKVKAFLEQHEIASTDSYHYCPKGSHQKLLIELERITNEIRTFFNLKDKRGVAYSYRENFIFTLRCFLSTWLYRTEVILNAIEQYRPVEVVCSGPLSLNAVRSIWTENEERFLADIICQLSEVHKFKVQILPMLDSKNVWKKSIFISIKSITRNAIGEIAKRLISFSSGSVLVPVNSHQIDLVFEDLYKETKGEKCFAFIGFPQKNKLKEFFRSVRNKRDHSYRYLFYDFDKKVPLDASFSQQCRHLEDQLLKFFQTWHYRKVSVFNWFKVKFDKAIKPEVIFKTYSHSENMLKYFSRWNPCFVMSQHARGIGAVIGELCRLKRIDSLMIPHGSFAAITDDISKKEWKENALGIVNTPYHFLALQTPLIEDFLKEIPVESKPVITGPLIFARKIATHRQGNDFRRRF
ncbi:MAG: hypothetical protein KC733_09250, partial [Candidatus Omnitrophica bacterium]|nr:hypothetical protein [Candidatus Omnitrophota bacterium]